jgi:hypothetical protein
MVKNMSNERRVFEGLLLHEDEMHSQDACIASSDAPGKLVYWQQWVDGLYGKLVRVTVEVLEPSAK